MISVQKAIFPGIALGCVFLVFITNLIARPGLSLASNLPVSAQEQGVLPGTSPSKKGETPLESAAAAPAAEGGPAAEGRPAVLRPAAEEQPAAIEQSASKKPEAEKKPIPKEQSAVDEQPAVVEQPAAEASQPECSLHSGYPEAIQQWCGIIVRYADEEGLDPNLIAAVMMQESGGNPDAYSKSGAVGLMQVMPRDGLAAGFMCINGPCFAARPSMAELSDPEFNVKFGVGMLAGLIRKHGDVREGLRAYGPMNYGYRYADIILSIKNRYE
jgi:soluble lytic murein transglycosylase-like protein